MTRANSPSLQRPYGTAQGCRIWGLSRATLKGHRGLMVPRMREGRPPRRRGPLGARGDADLLTAIRAIIEASPFLGEGYRKVGAGLRVHHFRTAVCRVRRFMTVPQYEQVAPTTDLWSIGRSCGVTRLTRWVPAFAVLSQLLM